MSSRQRLKQHLPFVGAVSLLIALFVLTIQAMTAKTQGNFIYALDDPYIHMSVAANFARFGVWGVVPYSFSSAVSSLSWPLLLSGFYALAGVNDYLPLTLNFIFAVALIALVHSWNLRLRLNGWLNFAVLSLLIIGMPLVPMIAIGMEHVLHALLTVGFAYLCVEYLDKPTKNTGGAVIALAFLLGATRYEGIVLVAAGCFLLLLHRQTVVAVLAGLAAWIPVVAYGLIAKAKGWYFLPNSVLLKVSAPGEEGELPSLLSIGKRFEEFTQTPEVFLLVTAVLMGLLLKPASGRTRNFAFLFLATALLHGLFGKLGWFFRYEAYLVVFGLCAAGGLVAGGITRPGLSSRASLATLLTLVFVLAFPLGWRGLKAARATPFASQNIFHQQVLVSEFLRQFYAGRSVAVNDIGAVSYFSGTRFTDLYGLSDLDVATSILNNDWNQAAFRRITEKNDVEIAILYKSYFGHRIPDEWIEVARWKIPNKTVVHSDVISFYAVKPDAEERLRKALNAFEGYMPKKVRYAYLE